MANFDVNQYYKFREKAPSHPPSNADLVAYEFEGFLVVRVSDDYILWGIKNLDGSQPPAYLRDMQFNKRSLAEKRISDFLEREKNNQKAMK